MIKPLLRRLIRTLGFRLIRDNHPATRYVDLVPSTPLDFVIAWLLPDLRHRTFLQIGAHDGMRNDPLFRWIERYDWQGTQVEPMPDFVTALRGLHRRRPGIRIIEAAVTDGPYAEAITLYRIDPQQPGLPAWAQGLATLDASRMRDAAACLNVPPETFQRHSVPAIAIPDLLTSLSAPTPDIVAIDTEGYDIRLARALLATGCRPTILHFEHSCCSADDRFAFVRELTDAGYESVSCGADTTAFRTDRRWSHPESFPAPQAPGPIA